MTIHTSGVRRIRIAEESTFGADLTGTLSAFDPIHFTQQPTMSLQYPLSPTGTMQQKMDGNPYHVATEQKRATLTLTANLTGLIERSTTSVTSAQTALGRLFKNYFGAQRLGQGDTADPGAGVNTVVIDNAARWEQGAGLAFVGGDGRIKATHIDVKTTATQTVRPDLIAADYPANGEAIYGCATYSMGVSAQDDATNTSIQAICEGLVTTDRFLLLGGKVTSITFNFPRGEIATVSITIQFVNWIYGADAATDLTSDTAPLTYVAETANGLPLAVHDSRLSWGAYGDAIADLHASAVTLACSPRWVPVPSTTGVNGVIGWARANVADLTSASIDVPFEDVATWMVLRDAAAGDPEDAAGELFFQVGSNDLVGAVLFRLRLQVLDVQPVEVDGLMYQRVTFGGGVPIASDTTEIDDSPFHLHMF